MPCIVGTRLWIRSNFGGRLPTSLGLFMQDMKVVVFKIYACTVLSYRANTRFCSTSTIDLTSVRVALIAMTVFDLAILRVCCQRDRLCDNSGGSNWRSAGQVQRTLRVDLIAAARSLN